jgi:Insertion element 4 transposase N-terminal/Transposase DDE domain
VYYVIALALFFGEAYEEVMHKMVGGLRLVSAWERAWKVPTASALCQARQRLGEEPLRQLFERAAAPLATPSTIGAWLSHRWRLMAIDGVTLDLADTPDNDKEFGRPSSRTEQGGAYPQVRVVGLGECGTRAIVAADLAPIRVGERELAERLLPDVEEGMLVIFDRGFFSYDLFAQVQATGAEALFRVSSTLKLPVLQRLADDSYLSVITPKGIPTPTSIGQARWHAAVGQAILVRVVEYQITDRPDAETYRLITTITDWRAALSGDLAAAYAQRWEFEIAPDEIETHQIVHSRVLRSKCPEMVRQEIWGILLAHYAIRALMVEAAHDADIDPDRLSFIQSLRVIRREADGAADFPPSQQSRRCAPPRHRRDPRTPAPAPPAPHLPQSDQTLQPPLPAHQTPTAPPNSLRRASHHRNRRCVIDPADPSHKFNGIATSRPSGRWIFPRAPMAGQRAISAIPDAHAEAPA